jgi:hypothetical protein
MDAIFLGDESKFILINLFLMSDGEALANWFFN